MSELKQAEAFKNMLIEASTGLIAPHIEGVFAVFENQYQQQGEWVSVDADLPEFDEAVRVWDDDGYSLDCYKERIARRMKTNGCGGWGWYELNMTNTMLQNVTHFAHQSPPKRD